MGAIEEFNSAESGAEEAALRISARWAVDELGFPWSSKAGQGRLHSQGDLGP